LWVRKSSSTLSQEECLIDLKKELDYLGFDRNNPSTFAAGQPDVRQRALTLIDLYLDLFCRFSSGFPTMSEIHL
jgi:hypothetical protein